MSTSSYIPPHLRNKQVTNEQSPSNEHKNPFQRERRAPRRPYEKPFWQIEQERAQLELEEKKKAAERGLEDTEENFPVLGGRQITSSGSVWTGARKFSELASDWKSADDQRKEEEEREKNASNTTYSDNIFPLPRFHNMHRFGEPEDEYCEDDDYVTEQQTPSEEKWTVVDNRKYRKPKPKFDLDEEDVKASHENEEDATVWGAPEEHETCWDERRY
jgi:hypothetical protein